MSRLGALALAVTWLCFANGCAKSEAAELADAKAHPAGEGICGDKNLPDCPLQSWMKATLKPYLAAHDSVRLARSLEELAEKAPPGFEGWKETALESAKAARGGDLAAAKSGCKHCHDAHRNRYRKERRTVAMF